MLLWLDGEAEITGRNIKDRFADVAKRVFSGKAEVRSNGRREKAGTPENVSHLPISPKEEG